MTLIKLRTIAGKGSIRKKSVKAEDQGISKEHPFR